jgi:hypothetical protein
VRFGFALLLCLALAPGILRGQSWVLKVPGPGLGNPLAVNPLNDDVLYAAAGANRVYVSRDRGYTWADYGVPVPGGGVVKSVCVNSPDTAQMIVGVESSVGSPDRVMKTSDGGLTWAETWSGTFSYYGQPLEFSPSHPDTAYTMGLDTLYRSVDFGSTWDTVCADRGFNAWCDAALRPDSAAVMYVGDNLSGIWKTADHGANWRKVYSTLGEIPSIAVDPFAPNVAYAGKFGGGGGLVKSSDWGETWHTLPVPSGNRDAWWVTCSREHPGYVYYGTYTGDTANLGIYVSRNSGASWSKTPGLPSGAYFNYGLLALDSLTVLALQSNGLYRYQSPAVIGVERPNGGEAWLADSQYTIAWSAAGIYAVRIEYSTDAGTTWNAVADSVPAGAGTYPWTTPATPSGSCLVRVSDALFTAASDVSDGEFTITGSFLTVVSPNGGEIWDAGSVKAVDWTSVGFDTLTVEYSNDGGGSWRYITKTPAAAGTFSWTVPDDPTPFALVRLRRSDDSSAADVSDAVFTILSPAEFSARIAFADGGAGRDTLVLGNVAGATDGIDAWLGESELPLPAPGLFDVRWGLAGTNGLAADFRDILAGQADVRRYAAMIQPGPGGYPVSVSWSPDSLRAGTFIFRDAATGGGACNVNMRRDSGVVVPDLPPAGDAVIEILQCGGVELVIPGNGEWRLVSVPVETGDRRSASIFPQAYSGVYAYRGGYEKRDTLRPGEGYWVRTERATLTGCPAPIDSIRVRQGWNMIGAPGAAVPVASLGGSPESLVVSPFYGYGSAGYRFSDSLIPGEGYWVKCRDSGVLLLPAFAAGRAPAVEWPFPARPPVELGITAGGRSSTLYAGPDAASRTLESPPQPPGETPLNSFKNGGIGVFHPASLNYPIDYEISIKTTESKIFFSWDVEIQHYFDYILIEKAGTQEVSKTRLSGGGVIGFSPSPESKYFLRVLPRGIGSSGTPRGFTISGWYPNPFNPTTRVALTVPSEAEVSYTVYDILGEVVSSSASHVYPAGEHVLEWSAVGNDGSPLGSGVYFIDVIAVPRGGDRSGSARTFRSTGKVAYVR